MSNETSKIVVHVIPVLCAIVGSYLTLLTFNFVAMVVSPLTTLDVIIRILVVIFTVLLLGFTCMSYVVVCMLWIKEVYLQKNPLQGVSSSPDRSRTTLHPQTEQRRQQTLLRHSDRHPKYGD